MKFHSTVNKAKKNQPSSWAKTSLGIAENKRKELEEGWREHLRLVKLFTVGKLRKISGWAWQTLPETAFCKVIAVLKTIRFFDAILNFCYLNFCPVRRSSLAGPINDKTWNLNQCTLYANVLVTTIKALEKITHSHKTKTNKTSPGYCPLKGGVTKINDFF